VLQFINCAGAMLAVVNLTLARLIADTHVCVGVAIQEHTRQQLIRGADEDERVGDGAVVLSSMATASAATRPGPDTKKKAQ